MNGSDSKSKKRRVSKGEDVSFLVVDVYNYISLDSLKHLHIEYIHA